MANRDMKIGAIDPQAHYRELQTNMSQYTVTSHMRPFIDKIHFLQSADLSREFAEKWRKRDVIMCYDILA